MRRLGLATLAVMAAGSSVGAQPAIITIRGDACDLSSLEASLTDTLAGRAVGDARISVVTHDGPTRSADVLLVDAHGRAHGPRTVTASSCDDLFEAVSLIVVMALPDPVAAPSVPDEHIETTPQPSPVTPVVAAPVPHIDPLSIAPIARADTGISMDGYVGGSSTFTGRGMNEQLLLGARLKRGRGSVALQARVDLPEEVRVSADGRVTVMQAELSVAPCVHVGAVAGCALLTAGLVHGSGETLEAARSTSTPLLATGIRVGWERFLTGRLGVRFHLDGRALLTSTRFEVDYMPVWQTSRFEGSAGVGLLARFL